MLFGVVAHPSRRDQAYELATLLNAVVHMDLTGIGALANHRRALQWAARQNGPVALLEDDAIPVPRFQTKAQSWHDRFPKHLVSLYLGSGRPPQYQDVVTQNIASAQSAGRDWIELTPTKKLPRTLLHGVGYMADASVFDSLLKFLPPQGDADAAIGTAYRLATHKNVIYPIKSLVEHADGASIAKHMDGTPRTDPRKARFLDL